MDRHAGKGQDIILETLKRRGEPVALTDIARQARGLHFADLQKAAEVLKKRGIITVSTNPHDGDVLTLIQGKSASAQLVTKVAELRRVNAALSLELETALQRSKQEMPKLSRAWPQGKPIFEKMSQSCTWHLQAIAEAKRNAKTVMIHLVTEVEDELDKMAAAGKIGLGEKDKIVQILNQTYIGT